MKTVLVTGAEGFIGKNLVYHLESLGDIHVLKYDVRNTVEQLEEFVEEAEFIFHLAGVNRPNDAVEYNSGNCVFTERLLGILKKSKNKAPILATSSIQAAFDTPYGLSKRSMEKLVFQYAEEMNVPVYVYRLPNVFGKWCRPNYNSVVATFCHNIANGLEIKVDNPDTQLNLVYIDDVIDEFISVLNGNAEINSDRYCKVHRVFKVTLKELADIIYTFADVRETLSIPDFNNDFKRFLYSTYLSYIPEGNLNYSLYMKHDKRGWLSEFIKSKESGQVFISYTKPGITRGNHWHHTKVEKFLVVKGEALIRLRKINCKDIIEYRVDGDNIQVVDIPAGYTHSITNIGENELITVFWSSSVFNPDKADTYHLEV